MFSVRHLVHSDAALHAAATHGFVHAGSARAARSTTVGRCSGDPEAQRIVGDNGPTACPGLLPDGAPYPTPGES